MTNLTFTEFDLQNPIGNNSLGSLALYFQRLLYKEEIYPGNLFSPLDTWYDKQYYGRIDRRQNTITPGYQNLSIIKTTAKRNLMALNLVVDAFEDFAGHMRNATILGVLRTQETNEKIFDMKAHKGFVDPTRLYNEFIQEVYNSFANNIGSKDKNKITNFQEFSVQFSNHLKTLARHIPITKTNYLLTNVGNSFNSGLSISIDDAAAEDDAYKYDKYINDPNFDFYVKAAKKFGLSVNKNMPWILTADLFSDAFLKYVNSYILDSERRLSEENFFDSYFDPTYLTDMDDLQTFIVNSYKLFAENNPLYETRKYKENCDKFVVKNLNREQLPSDVNKVLTDKVLSLLYLDLRSLEAKEPIQVTSKLKQELANIFQLQPNQEITKMQNVANYINLIFRDYIYETEYPLLNDNLFKDLDNRVRAGKISTVGSIAQQLY